MSKFYTFHQNNSGGYWVGGTAAGIGQHVIVEALSASEANRRAEGIGLYFYGDGDCSCCGYRWSPAGEGSGTDTPMVYDVPLKKSSETEALIHGGGRSVCVHYLDGLKEWF